MSTAVLEEKRSEAANRPPVINDFSIHVATANGSGSQSSNTILMRAIFQMGIPVSGKNLFPSNIQGLPTWFTIRASKEGFIARRRDVGVSDLHEPGDRPRRRPNGRAGRGRHLRGEPEARGRSATTSCFYPVPFQKLVLELVHDGKLRRLAVNMIYVGVAAWLLGIDMAEIEKAVAKQFKGKADGRRDQHDGDPRRARVGREEPDQARPLPRRAHERDRRQDHHRGQRRGGDRLHDGRRPRSWPGTRSRRPPRWPSRSSTTRAGYRIDPETGKSTFAVVQAEDELAAARHGPGRRLGRAPAR